MDVTDPISHRRGASMPRSYRPFFTSHATRRILDNAITPLDRHRQTYQTLKPSVFRASAELYELHMWAGDREMSTHSHGLFSGRYGGIGLTLAVFLALTQTACPAAYAGGSTSSGMSGSYKCEIVRADSNARETSERLNVQFDVHNGVVKKFTSSWVVSSDSPDVRPGYAATCNADFGKFRQTQQTGGIVLKYLASDQEKDQERCEIRIHESQSLIHISSYACTYPCLALNLAIDRNTGVCHQAK
jgi:hypothetical protein